MKNIVSKLVVSLFFTLGLVSFVNAQEIKDKAFIGHWVGHWDKSYIFCLDISSIEKGEKVEYRWQEQPKGAFSHSQKSVKRINKNTIKMENILLVIDQEDPSLAMALGIFKYQTRRSFMIKKTSIDSSCVAG
ncbi:MAG: hypothetical protein Q9M92_10370 [Enterobacterales bacterium]|nr:hypothetical protein [Enterobacterales bacterium]